MWLGALTLWPVYPAVEEGGRQGVFKPEPGKVMTYLALPPQTANSRYIHLTPPLTCYSRQ